MHFPNSSVISPDEKTLIVAETMSGLLTVFDIGAGEALSNRRVWATTFPRVPDGITLDADGNIWIANPRAPECARVARAGDDGRTLFMLTAPPLAAAWDLASPPAGRLLVAYVDTPHAGYP
jgi:sugar lactone lactonase YvrE